MIRALRVQTAMTNILYLHQTVDQIWIMFCNKLIPHYGGGRENIDTEWFCKVLQVKFQIGGSLHSKNNVLKKYIIEKDIPMVLSYFLGRLDHL